MTNRAGFLLILTACIAGMVGCGNSSSGPAGKQIKASAFCRSQGWAALAETLKSNDLTIAGQLLNEGVDINSVGKDGITLATWTIIVKNKPSFKWLFDHGANPNLIPPNDRGISLWSAGGDDPYWLDILLQHKADVNLQRKSDREDTETPLSEAIFECRKRNLEMLIKAGAEINFRGPEDMDAGATPGIHAAGIGWFEGVYILLEAGADFRPRTTGGLDLADEVVRHSQALNDDNTRWREKVIQLLRSRVPILRRRKKRCKRK